MKCRFKTIRWRIRFECLETVIPNLLHGSMDIESAQKPRDGVNAVDPLKLRPGPVHFYVVRVGQCDRISHRSTQPLKKECGWLRTELGMRNDVEDAAMPGYLQSIPTKFTRRGPCLMCNLGALNRFS